MSKYKNFISIIIFSLSIFFVTFYAVQADDSDLSSEVQTVRATYGSTISHEQASKILDTVAWSHKDEGWGLLSKSGGNHCPLGSTFIACDILFNKNSGSIYDVFSSGPGICNDISAAGKAGLSWNLSGQGDMSLWVEPIDPVLLPDGMGNDVVLPDTTVCKGDATGNFPAQPNLTPPTQGLPTNLGQLIQQIFTWSLGILGIAVFLMFFYSGFLYLTAAGNTARTGDAKTHMTNAVFGAILLLSAYLILYTINPDFVKSTVNLPGLGDLKK